MQLVCIYSNGMYMQVEKKNMKWSGSFMMDSKSDEETTFTVTHDSNNLVSLYVLWIFALLCYVCT